MLAVIVTGSRDWPTSDDVYAALDDIEPDVVIHGACPTGADRFAAKWCRGDRSDDSKPVAEVAMPAQWDKLGRGAGPRRNQEMLSVLRALSRCGYETVVLAFPLPSSVGTRHMMDIARIENIDVQEWVSRESAKGGE